MAWHTYTPYYVYISPYINSVISKSENFPKRNFFHRARTWQAKTLFWQKLALWTQHDPISNLHSHPGTYRQDICTFWLKILEVQMNGSILWDTVPRIKRIIVNMLRFRSKLVSGQIISGKILEKLSADLQLSQIFSN